MFPLMESVRVSYEADQRMTLTCFILPPIWPRQICLLSLRRWWRKGIPSAYVRLMFWTIPLQLTIMISGSEGLFLSNIMPSPRTDLVSFDCSYGQFMEVSISNLRSIALKKFTETIWSRLITVNIVEPWKKPLWISNLYWK